MKSHQGMLPPKCLAKLIVIFASCLCVCFVEIFMYDVLCLILVLRFRFID